MANTKNNSLSKDKVLSALCLIIFVLLFIFSCLSKTIPFGAKIIGTFGAVAYPVFLMISFICLIRFLGFSYKRNLKATVLMICFIYCFLAVVHSIRTFSVLDSVVTGSTYMTYINYSYSHLTLLGSIGSALCGAISYLLGGMGTIVVFVILGTLFIGFFIDFELYGKYKENHIKKLKSKKMRDKVLNSDSNMINGKPVYSFTNDLDKYSSDDVVAEITADYSEENQGNYYSQNDVVDEITDGKIYNYNNDDRNFYPNYDLKNKNEEEPSYFSSNIYENNERMFGNDAVTSNENNEYTVSESLYSDLNDENEQRRQFLNATYNGEISDYGNDYSSEGYSSLLSKYQTNNDNYNNMSSGYNSYSSNESESTNNYSSYEDNNQIDSYESFTNHYYGGASFENLNDNLNDVYSNSSNNYSGNTFSNETSYNSYNQSNNSNSYSQSNTSSSGLDFLNEEIKESENSYLDNNQSNENFDYGNTYNNDSNSFNSNQENNKNSFSFNVDDQISKILNKDENLDTHSNNDNLDLSSSFLSDDELNKIIKDDINNDYSNISFKDESNDVKTKIYDDNARKNNDVKSSYSQNLNTETSDLGKIKIPAKDSQVKKFSGFNLGMSSVKYNPPPVSLLNPVVKDEGNYEEEQQRKASGLEKALKAFNIPVTVVNIVRGPKITRYELSVPLGVSIKKIPSYELDIKKTLAAKTVNIQAPIPGSEYVGIELENDSFTNVNIRELIESDAFKNNNDILPFVVGKDISGEIIVKSLAKMVHMLIAGQTGSGKSVFIHTVIMSLIYKYSPDDLRLVLMDPKRVEFNIYNGIPHLLTPEVVLGTEKSVNALKWCVAEMDRRYELMSKAGYNHITSYNNSELVKSGQLPRFCYIVIIVDEFAEVIMENKKEAEPCIQRLTQLARACGMHLILATQRPSVDVISGVIKNNVPSRIAFSLASSFDSKTIIGTTGAENLLGQGDMLFAPNGTSVIQRLQAAYCTDEEIKKIIDYDIQNNEAHYDESAAAMINESNKSSEYSVDGGNVPPPKELDSYFKIALKMFIQKGDASGSYLQRRLQIGYSRAAKIMDQLEDRGYIASANGGKVRKVLMTAEQFKNEFGEDVDINSGSDY